MANTTTNTAVSADDFSSEWEQFKAGQAEARRILESSTECQPVGLWTRLVAFAARLIGKAA